MANVDSSNHSPPIPPPVGSSSIDARVDSDDGFEMFPSSVPKELKKNLTLPPMYVQPTHMGWNGRNSYQQYTGAGVGAMIPNYYGAMNLPNHHLHNSNYNHWIPARRNVAFDPTSNGLISRLAEEKARTTFGSIEMILDAFSSINYVLESTYSAIHNSFKTLTGVADHLIFVRNHLTQIALFSQFGKILLGFFRWLLQCFGLSEAKIVQNLNAFQEEQIWSEAVANQDSINRVFDESSSKHLSPWPVLTFLSLILGTPYIIWKLLGAPGSIPRSNLPDWTLKTGRHFIAIGLYDFKARNNNELSFQKNQRLFVKPESLQPGSKWIIGCTISEIPKLGFIPLNYIKLVMK